MIELHGIQAVFATAEEGVLLAQIDCTDQQGIRGVREFASRADDPFGLGPLVRQAIEDWQNDGNEVAPYVAPPEPTDEELRAAMAPLTARQLRLGLIANGLTLASVQAAVDGISDPTEREIAQVEWEYATTFERTHSLISQIGAALSLTHEQIDTMWEAAIAL